MNGTPIFKGEHCECSCVHPCLSKLNRAAGVALCSATLSQNGFFPRKRASTITCRKTCGFKSGLVAPRVASQPVNAMRSFFDFAYRSIKINNGGKFLDALIDALIAEVQIGANRAAYEFVEVFPWAPCRQSRRSGNRKGSSSCDLPWGGVRENANCMATPPMIARRATTRRAWRMPAQADAKLTPTLTRPRRQARS